METSILRKMGKIGLCFVCCFLTVGLFFTTGCQGQEKEYNIDPVKLTDDVLQNVKFASDMIEVDKDSLSTLYTIDDGIEVKAYIAGGTIADEIVVFTAQDADASGRMLEHAKAYIQDRTEAFSEYAPAEVAKLQKSYTVQKGKYVVVCITDDIDNAKEIINKHF